jgi:hypothetical protein
VASKRKPFAFEINNYGCFNCVSHKNLRGRKDLPYPQIKLNGRKTSLCRYIYEAVHGPIPEGLIVRHKCDNPLCINPVHLELGTPADNVRDMVERNRQASSKGSKNGNSKLTEEDVKLIRSNGERAVDLAERFGVHPATIWRVRQGVTWR